MPYQIIYSYVLSGNEKVWDTKLHAVNYLNRLPWWLVFCVLKEISLIRQRLVLWWEENGLSHERTTAILRLLKDLPASDCWLIFHQRRELLRPLGNCMRTFRFLVNVHFQVCPGWTVFRRLSRFRNLDGPVVFPGRYRRCSADCLITGHKRMDKAVFITLFCVRNWPVLYISEKVSPWQIATKARLNTGYFTNLELQSR